MDAALRDTVRQRLLEREALLRDEVRAHRQQLLEADAADHNSFVAGHEGAVADANDALDIAQIVHAQRELDLVVQALQRLDGDRYGRCQGCGEPIGEDRLRAVPQARLCIQCQRAADHDLP